MAASSASSLNVDVFLSLDAARPALDALAGGGCYYQGEGFLRAWLDHGAGGATPFFVAVSDAEGAALALLPLCRRRIGPVWLARFIGGKDSNLNIPLRREGFAPDLGGLRDILRRVEIWFAQGPMIFALGAMPALWRGVPTLFAPHFTGPDADPHYSVTLSGGFDAFFRRRFSSAARKKQRAKQRRLAEIGPLSCFRAQTPDQRAAALSAFFAFQRAAPRYLAQATTGAANRRFARALAQCADFELHVLQAGARVVAVFGAGRMGDVLQGQFIGSDRTPEAARCSPGEILLHFVVADAFSRKIAIFELGVGAARYKEEWCCAQELGLFLFAPNFFLTFAVVPLLRALMAAKREIKHRPKLLALAQGLFLLVEKRKGRGFRSAPAIDRGDEAL